MQNMSICPTKQKTRAGRVEISKMVRPAGIEPAQPAPEAGALSPELRAH